MGGDEGGGGRGVEETASTKDSELAANRAEGMRDLQMAINQHPAEITD